MAPSRFGFVTSGRKENVIDNEIIGMAKRILKGIIVDKEALTYREAVFKPPRSFMDFRILWNQFQTLGQNKPRPSWNWQAELYIVQDDKKKSKEC